uniref:Anaphase-promoting complex subunit 4 WD40 domain-containing protein n=1 Tax=Fibrocapsa japonica TaxID=94617 RepID=A0A7S2XUZ9_9STRA|mmetsp:Transcript_14426/g.21231  ORF Transcript_14426/g.21231 Transcript_14426/m.21231 type:complete len:349 (+) Transcript_14426:59-1105(+)
MALVVSDSIKRAVESSADEEQQIVKKIRVGGEMVEVHPEFERTSNLMSPTMMLTGHQAAVYSLQFDPSGQNLASGSFDKTIMLWSVYGECTNYNVLRAHKNAVLQVQWSPDGSRLISASADRTIGLWDPNTGKLKKKLQAHSGVVNSCAFGRRGNDMVASGSDDATLCVWDTRMRKPADVFECDYAVLAVGISKDNDQVFAAGLGEVVQVWDVRKGQVSLELEGHHHTITGMSLSPDGSYLLTNSMDNTLRQWDVRPFVQGSRCSKVYTGLQHNFEQTLLRCGWSPSGEQVASGSADRVVHVWDEMTTQELYHLPGHTGSVNEVSFHPKEPIIGSCGSDKVIYLGELS